MFFSLSDIEMRWIIVFIAILVQCECLKEICSNVKSPLNLIRKRRHLTFPKKSAVVLTISLVKAFMTHAPSGWNIALEIDVPYDLPDAKFTNKYFRRKLHHRQKREFWQTLENALELQSINGRSCIVRSVCEAKIHIAARGKSLVHDILRVIFTASTEDENFMEEMEDYNELKDLDVCEQKNDCPFSLLDYILSLNKN